MFRKKNLSYFRKRKTIIAFHNEGHAIIGIVLPNSNKALKISSILRGQTSGHVLMRLKDDKLILTKKEIFSRIVGYLGCKPS